MNKLYIYGFAIIIGIISGYFNIPLVADTAKFISEVFIRVFKCISMPVVSLSVIVALACYGDGKNTSRIWKKALQYTTITTLTAASVAAVLYYVINPPSVPHLSQVSSDVPVSATGYTQYFLEIIPDSISKAFIDHKVLSVLLISVIFGLSVRYISETKIKDTLTTCIQGVHSIFFAITKFIVRILPIGMFGFVSVSVKELQHGMNLQGMGKYFIVIICANLVQGLIVLPTWLASKGINPIKAFKGMSPALSVAFFAKSSSGALPVTIQSAEENLHVDPKVSRFVLPLCTTINMNGCAAFIFTTVIYVMQNYGVNIDLITVLTWIVIASLAAIGNAGVPMGCFFLSASLLSSMNIPMPLLGIILPIYSVIDMLETALNVWSDSCVALTINKKIASSSTQPSSDDH